MENIATPPGQARHHLVEKRFWQQLDFANRLEGEQSILAVFVDATLHGPRGKGEKTLTDRLRDAIPYNLTKQMSPQQIWEVHRDVYKEFGHEDWADLIWEIYFAPLGVAK